MNEETFEYLKSVILRLDTAGHGVKFTGAEAASDRRGEE